MAIPGLRQRKSACWDTLAPGHAAAIGVVGGHMRTARRPVATTGLPATPSTATPPRMWHTQFCPSSAPLPHEIQINLGASYTLSAFQYLPRQDGCGNGWIKQYEFYVSTDGVNWGTPVAAGTFNYGALSTNLSRRRCAVGDAGELHPADRAVHPSARAVGDQRQSLDLGGRNQRAGSSGQRTALAALASVSVNPAMVVGGSLGHGNGDAQRAGPVGRSGGQPVQQQPAVGRRAGQRHRAGREQHGNFTVTTTSVSSSTR